MIKKKICLLGAFAVGKTSLIERYVQSVFSDKYHATVGVKVDKKEIRVADQEVTLLIWDVQGEDEIQKINANYLRGSAGFFLVVDGTRRETVEVALEIAQRTVDAVGEIPLVVLLNKTDLEDEWELGADEMEKLSARGWLIARTSAKSGLGVEEAFQHLVVKILSS